MEDSHLQCLLGFCSSSQSESLVWTFVGLRLTSCNRMRILWPMKCWHTLFSFIPAVGPGRKSVHLPHSIMAKLFLGVTWVFFFFSFLHFIAFRNLSAVFSWSSSMSTHHLTWGWDVKGLSAFFCRCPSPAQIYGWSHGGSMAESRKWGGTNAGPNCISETKHKSLKSLKSMGESF